MLITPDRRFKSLNFSAELVELADTRVLGTRIARCEGSSPLFRTKKTSESNSTRRKNCCTRCCIEEQMLHTVKGKLIVGLTSKTLVSLRKNRTLPHPFTTAYYSSIAMSFN